MVYPQADYVSFDISVKSPNFHLKTYLLTWF